MKVRLTVCAALLSMCASGCAESFFNLAPDSRLPKWFSLPPGLSRADVTVSLAYYVFSPARPGRSATFKLWDSHGNKLAQASGSLRGLEPIAFGPRAPEGGVGYPSYEVITVNGITELIEQRRPEPIFYISDDSDVKAKLGLPTTD